MCPPSGEILALSQNYPHGGDVAMLSKEEVEKIFWPGVL